MYTCELKDIKGTQKRVCIDYFWPFEHEGYCAIGYIFEARKYGYWLVVVYHVASMDPVSYACVKSDRLRIYSNRLEWFILDCLHRNRGTLPNNLNSYKFLNFTDLEHLPKCKFE